MKEIKGTGITLLGIEKAGPNFDSEMAEIFRQMRLSFDLETDVLARELGTTPQTLESLETGFTAELPKWDELSPIVTRYAEALELEPEPILRRLALNLSAHRDAQELEETAQKAGRFLQEQERGETPEATENSSLQDRMENIEESLREELETEPDAGAFSQPQISPSPTPPPPAFENTENMSETVADPAIKPQVSPKLQNRLDELVKNHPDNLADRLAAAEYSHPFDQETSLSTPSLTQAIEAAAHHTQGPLSSPNAAPVQQSPFPVTTDSPLPTDEQILQQEAFPQQARATSMDAETSASPLVADARFDPNIKSQVEKLPNEFTGLNPNLFQPPAPRHSSLLFKVMLFGATAASAYLGWLYVMEPALFTDLLIQLKQQLMGLI